MGKKYSTIENEKNNNPRLQVKSAEEYAEIMNNLKLKKNDPEMIRYKLNAVIVISLEALIFILLIKKGLL